MEPESAKSAEHTLCEFFKPLQKLPSKSIKYNPYLEILVCFRRESSAVSLSNIKTLIKQSFLLHFHYEILMSEILNVEKQTYESGRPFHFDNKRARLIRPRK